MTEHDVRTTELLLKHFPSKITYRSLIARTLEYAESEDLRLIQIFQGRKWTDLTNGAALEADKNFLLSSMSREAYMYYFPLVLRCAIEATTAADLPQFLESSLKRESRHWDRFRQDFTPSQRKVIRRIAKQLKSRFGHLTFNFDPRTIPFD